MQSAEDKLDLDVLDAVAGLFTRLMTEGEQVAKEFAVPSFFMKALHLIDGPLAMKELGQRMNCDPSFVTGIADMLEKRGLAVRESDPVDRRVKRLVLTTAGLEMKHLVEQEFLARSPWRRALTVDERASLVELMHKMAPPRVNDAPSRAEEVTDLLSPAP
ncbi:MAG TPA: MarR family transcriptional regulator [Streptosporangiaceae bacterium]|jgi:DNA-binding MarR family transcriptional regulator|nr:MarR family transcriptional regulator [Streptosporangiaceae bacterium]